MVQVVIGEEELRKRLDVAASKISKLKEQLASSTSDQEKQTVRAVERVHVTCNFIFCSFLKNLLLVKD